jgi:O-antigen/teichoic acid export membrane protein
MLILAAIKEVYYEGSAKASRFRDESRRTKSEESPQSSVKYLQAILLFLLFCTVIMFYFMGPILTLAGVPGDSLLIGVLQWTMLGIVLVILLFYWYSYYHKRDHKSW